MGRNKINKKQQAQPAPQKDFQQAKHWNNVSTPPEHFYAGSMFRELCARLHTFYQRLHAIRQASIQQKPICDTQDMFTKWLDYYQELCDKNYFLGNQESVKTILNSVISPNMSEEILMKSFNFFESAMLRWECRIDARLVSKLQQMNFNQQEFVYANMFLLLRGQFTNCSGEKVNRIEVSNLSAYNAYFMQHLFSERYLLFMLSHFKYVHCMRFLDIIGQRDSKNSSVLLAKFVSSAAKDPGRCDFDSELKGKLKGSTTNAWKYGGAELFTEMDVGKDQTRIECIYSNPYYKDQFASKLYFPSQFKVQFLSKAEEQNLVLDPRLNRYVLRDRNAQLESRNLKDFVQRVNRELLKKFADFKSASKLVELLQKIPNFRIRLTDEEMSVVGQDGNVMVIGRSGTGKTTCAVLRLFSIEMLFKMRMTLYKQKYSSMLRDTRFDADDIDKTIGLHCVFVTASPVLTNEVRRYYRRLTEQIKSELEKKKRRVAEEKQRNKEAAAQQQQQQGEGASEQIIASKETEEGVSQEAQEAREGAELHQVMEEQLRGITLVAQREKRREGEEEEEEEEVIVEHNLQEDDAIEQEEINDYMQRAQSLNDLKEEDFPGFFTLRSLLLLIDGCLLQPFFARTQDGKIIGADAKSTWHSESRGVLVIDNYFKKIQAAGASDKKNNDNNDQQDNAQMFEDEELSEGSDYSDEEALEAEYQRQVQLQQNNKKREIFENAQKSKLSFEVDFNYFRNYFWPTVQKLLFKEQQGAELTPTTVWTEIYSHIKGSADSHTFYGWYLSYYYYVYQDTKRSFLSEGLRKTVYNIFQQYELWKSKNCAYDLMDVVNYMISQIQRGRYLGTSIHYMMVDEVQDLPHAVLHLLMRVTEQGLFFAGDTAQNIAQGVGARFCDLQSLFKHSIFGDGRLQQHARPIVKQLTTNFRSHNRILELANSVVTCLECFFPQTIDKMRKERSNLDGEKPVILDSGSIDLLFLLLSGSYQQQYQPQLLQAADAPAPLEFGCNQVIIVRDQESKDRLPRLLSHALCLTIYEAKGLEFDDVILYNFFKDSKVGPEKWALLRDLQVHEEWISEEEFTRTTTVHEQQMSQFYEQEAQNADQSNLKKQEEQDDSEEEKEQEGAAEKISAKKEQMIFGTQQFIRIDGKVLVRSLKRSSSRKMKQKIAIEFTQLCVELKQLYVGVTRPKKRLIIFDEEGYSEQRNYLQKYWQQLQIVELANSQTLQEEKNSGQFRQILLKTSQNEWRKQGLNMFKNRYFEQAMKCFEQSGDKELLEQATAYHTADSASKQLVEIASERELLQSGTYKYFNMKQAAKKQAQKELKFKENQALQLFKTAGKLFAKHGKKKQAAQCLFSGHDYKQAAQVYEEIAYTKQAAEAYFLMRDYRKAAELFDKSGDYLHTIECLDMLNDFEKILEIVHKYTLVIPQRDKEIFIRKYASLALEELVHHIEARDDLVVGVQEKLVQEDDGIQEEEEEEEELSDQDIVSDEQDAGEEVEEEEEEEEQKAEPAKGLEVEQDAPKEVQEQAAAIEQMSFTSEKEDQEIEQMKFSDEEEKESPENEQKSQPLQSKNKVNVSTMSFSEIGAESQKNQSEYDVISAAGDGKANDEQSYEHLLLDDEWVERESVIESVRQSRLKGEELQSEYSVIEGLELCAETVANRLLQGQLVRTKADIVAQDSTMQKIIHYVSMFSEDLQRELQRLRSYNSLLGQKQTNEAAEPQLVDEDDLNIDLDSVDMQFIYLILDTLEVFKIYKLCIFVCNRYRLAQRLGRYVVSIAHRYSTVANDNVSLSHHLLIKGGAKQMMQEKAFVAASALHSIFENINPDLLRPPVQPSAEQLPAQPPMGTNSFSQLILMGYWKQVIFFLDNKNACALASAFADFRNYKYFAQNRSIKVSQTLTNIYFDDVVFASSTPNGASEIELAFICLEQLLWDKSEIIHRPAAKDQLVAEALTFPSYFAFTAVLVNYMLQPTQPQQHLLEYLSSATKNLTKVLDVHQTFQSEAISLRVYDLITFATLLVEYSAERNVNTASLRELLTADRAESLPLSDFMDFTEVFRKLLRVFSESFIPNRHNSVILRALLAPFRVRVVPKHEGIYSTQLFAGNHALVHVSSPIVQDLLNSKNQRISRFQAQNVDITKSVVNEIFFIDLDHQFLIAPLEIVLHFALQRLQKQFSQLIRNRAQRAYISLASADLVTPSQINARAQTVANVMGLQQLLWLPMSELAQKGINDPYIALRHESRGLRQDYLVRRHRDMESFERARRLEALFVDDDPEDVEKLRSYVQQHQYVHSKSKHRKETGLKTATNKSQQMKQFLSLKSELHDLLAYNIGHSAKPLHRLAREALAQLVQLHLDRFFANSESDFRLSSLVKARRLLAFMHQDYAFFEITRRIRRTAVQNIGKKNYRALRQLDEWYAFLQYGLTEDYSDFLFQYFSNKFFTLQGLERIRLLQQNIVINLVALASGAQHPSLLLSAPLVRFLPGETVCLAGDSATEVRRITLKTTVNRLDTYDILAECLYWLEQIIEKAEESFVYQETILILVINIILNIESGPSTLFQQIIKILEELTLSADIRNHSVFQALTRCAGFAEARALRDQLIQRDAKDNNNAYLVFEKELGCTQQQIDDLNRVRKQKLNLEYQQAIERYSDAELWLVEIVLDNDASREDQNYALSDQEYLHEAKLLAKRATAARTILHSITQQQQSTAKNIKRFRDKNIKSPLIYWHFAAAFNQTTTTSTLQKITQLSLEFNSVYELILKIEELKRQILHTYFQTHIDNALDFHHITENLSQNTKNLEDLTSAIMQYLVAENETTARERLNATFIAIKKEVEKRISHFNLWCQTNVKFEANARQIFNKNKKILTMKWATRTLLKKRQALSKKRTGLKKQQALERRSKLLAMGKKK